MRFKDNVEATLDEFRQYLLTIREQVGRLTGMSDTIETELAQLRTDMDANTAATGNIVAYIQGEPQRIADAIAKAQAAQPLTPEQKAAFDELEAAATQNTAQLVTALPASAQPSDPGQNPPSDPNAPPANPGQPADPNAPPGGPSTPPATTDPNPTPNP